MRVRLEWFYWNMLSLKEMSERLCDDDSREAFESAERMLLDEFTRIESEAPHA